MNRTRLVPTITAMSRFALTSVLRIPLNVISTSSPATAAMVISNPGTGPQSAGVRQGRVTRGDVGAVFDRFAAFAATAAAVAYRASPSVWVRYCGCGSAAATCAASRDAATPVFSFPARAARDA